MTAMKGVHSMAGGTARKATVLAAAAVTLALAATAGATTGPGALAHVPIILTATKVTVAKDKFTLPSQPNLSRFPRGATIDFKITNKGPKPAVFVLRLTSKLHFVGASGLKKLAQTPPIKPGKFIHMKANFFFRARFEFQEIVGGKIVARTPMVIF